MHIDGFIRQSLAEAQLAAARRAEPRGQRKQTGLPIELGILASVDHVEAGDPQQHRRAEKPGHEREPAGDRDPSTDRGDGQWIQLADNLAGA